MEDQLQDLLRGYVRDFRIVVGEKGLLLRGRSLSYYAKQLAQHAVMRTTDVPIQANEIVVSRPVQRGEGVDREIAAMLPPGQPRVC